MPNPPRDKLEFATIDGKAQFSINDAPNISVPDGHFVMMTIRSHDQYNTTIYGLDDRYRGIKGNRRVVMMNANDMVDNELKSRDLVNITSHYENLQITSENWLVIPYKIPKGNIAAYFPEANELVPLESTADISNTPTSNGLFVLSENLIHRKRSETVDKRILQVLYVECEISQIVGCFCNFSVG